MSRLGKVQIGGNNPTRIMGIINASPESFYKKSIKLSNAEIRDAVLQMESDGADFVDVGGMSTAPYISTFVSEKTESSRILKAIKAIQNASNIPISVDTCRASVAKAALDNGVDIINDISGLKFDKNMGSVLSSFEPSVILCAYSPNMVIDDPVESTRILLRHSIVMARKCGISSNQIVLDPAIGFFRKSGKGRFFTKTKQYWADRDLQILSRLKSIKQRHSLLVSVSNKSFLGDILGKKTPSDRLYGTLAAEVISVLNGADVIRTHNVAQTRDAITVVAKVSAF